jgi:hypothetical protein
MYRETPKKDHIERIALELSWDHKPTRADEKQRILESGGKIEK